MAVPIQNAQRTTTGLQPLGHHAVVALAIMLTALSLALVADALAHSRAFFDLQLARAVQRINLPFIEVALWPVDQLTSAVGAITTWAALTLVLLAARWWLPALAMLCLPVAGAVDNAIGFLVVDRARPTADQLARVTTDTDPSSFPSGHVIGAVLLYGLVFLIAGRFENVSVRLGIRALCVWVIAIAGFARVWYGAHWPTDVLGAYAMGGVLLIMLVMAYRAVERAGGPRPAADALARRWRRLPTRA